MKVKVCVELEVEDEIGNRPFSDLQDSLSSSIGVMFEGLSEIRSDDFSCEYIQTTVEKGDRNERPTT